MQKYRKKAGDIAGHTTIAGIVIGVVVAFSIFPLLEKIFLIMGATSTIASIAADYGRIIIFGSPFIFLSFLGSAILRGEGDAKRAMYIMIISAIINIFLDPIFIYYFNLGVNGAAIATVISILFSAVVIIYWLLLKKDAYVQFSIRHFVHNWEIIKEIFRVGIPSSLAQISISLTMMLINTMVIMAG